MSGPVPDEVFIEALEECSARVRSGEPLSRCLEDYPAAYREALVEYVPVTVEVRGVAVEPAAGFVSGLEGALLEAWDARAASRRRRWSRSLWGSPLARVAAAAALCLLLLSGTGFVAVEASSDALPGEPLYQVKLLRERVELWLARSDSAQLSAYEARVDRRASELERAVDAAPSGDVVVRLEEGLAQSVREVVTRALRMRAGGHPEAVTRALATIDAAEARARRLAAATDDPRSRVVLQRIERFLEAQRARLDQAQDAPARRAAIRD